MFQGWVRKRIWLQVIVGIGAIALNMLPVSSDIFKVDSLCRAREIISVNSTL